jgi:hypothetical protein
MMGGMGGMGGAGMGMGGMGMDPAGMQRMLAENPDMMRQMLDSPSSSHFTTTSNTFKECADGSLAPLHVLTCLCLHVLLCFFVCPLVLQ